MRGADVVVIALAAALVGALFARYWAPPAPAQTVEIRSPDGVARYALDRPQRVEIAGARGTSIIEIGDGAARFRASPCRNQACVHSGWQRHGGDVAACVPNRVSLLLVGGATAALDAISQ